MAIIVMVLRKMRKNKLLVACLVLGLIIAVALLSSIPMYTEGVLQNLVVKEIEQYQMDYNKFGGSYQVSVEFFGSVAYPERKKIYNKLDEYIQDNMIDVIKLPILAEVKRGTTVTYPVIEYGEDIEKLDKGRRVQIQSMTDMEDNVVIVEGRKPGREVKDGIYEVMATQNALNRLDLLLDRVYLLTEPGSRAMRDIKIKPVAVIEPKEESSFWWYTDPDSFSSSVFIDADLFARDFIQSKAPLLRIAEWYYAFDYSKITLGDIHRFIEGKNKIEKFAKDLYPRIKFDVPTVDILESYLEEEKQLRMMLWALSVPVILLLVFYLCMVSSIIIESEKNEIAIMQSRGSSKIQILFSYLLEGLILGLAAMLAGPPLGLLLTRFLGSTSGFMEFVQRKALRIGLSPRAYEYGSIAVVASIVILLVLAYRASKTNIVIHKRQMARKTKKPLWKRMFLDFILLGIGGVGLYLFEQRQRILEITGVSARDIDVDQFLFFTSTIFVLGCGLLFMRIYPLIVKLIYRVGRRWWPPSMYASLIQVGRATREYQVLMLFLILTMATGLFSANAARTINSNGEERIRYAIGTDVSLMPVWESDQPVTSPLPGLTQQTQVDTSDVQYEEPPFEPYTKLAGVEHAAKVFRRTGVKVNIENKSVSGVTLMAIEPYDFSKVLWFRSDLLRHHINVYLNLLNEDPSAALLSRSFAEQYKVKVGDYITLSWDDLNEATFYVYGFVDYWPSWNPKKTIEGEDAKQPMAVIANLSYVQNQLKLEPYEIWLKLSEGATSAELYNDIQQKNVMAYNIKDASQEIIKERNDPFRLAINGILTLGFIISLVITFLGFLIYWMLSIGRRTLEFGVLRAMGIPLRQLIGMIGWEQALTSLMGIVAGFVIGAVTSNLYVPLFQFTASAVDQVPPFRVVSLMEDRVKLYAIVVLMLSCGLAVLGRQLAALKIHQALKLGED